ncbi:hypothetical protein [Streptomyces sp. NPDC029674]|uniref:hypothetical protein n=1 Tax=Streptomyces sp. NPDC029674 TaxID=3365297 RepID=UPI00384D5038
MSKKQSRTRTRANQRIAIAIALLICGEAYCQTALSGTAADIGRGVLTLALLGCVIRLAFNARAERKT